MITIAIANQKGGVGKTATALAIGQGLQLQGYRVLFVDMDLQGNLTDTLRAKEQSPSTMQVLTKQATIEQALQMVEGCSVLGSSASISGADGTLTGKGREYRLKQGLQPVLSLFDYCIIDTPPTLGITTINALTACNQVIIPAKADSYSLKGLSQLQATIQAVKAHSNPQLKVEGIVITEHQNRSILSRDLCEMLNKTALLMGTKVFNTKIRKCTAIKEAAAVKQSIYTYSPRSNAVKDYNALIDEILKD